VGKRLRALPEAEEDNFFPLDRFFLASVVSGGGGGEERFLLKPIEGRKEGNSKKEKRKYIRLRRGFLSTPSREL